MPKIVQILTHVRDCPRDAAQPVEHSLLALDDEGQIWEWHEGGYDEEEKRMYPGYWDHKAPTLDRQAFTDSHEAYLDDAGKLCWRAK